MYLGTNVAANACLVHTNELIDFAGLFFSYLKSLLT